MESIVVELSKSQPKVYILSNAIESKNIGNRMLYLLYLPLLFLPSVANTYLPILYKGSPQWYNRPPKCTILFAHTILFNILSLSAVSTVLYFKMQGTVKEARTNELTDVHSSSPPSLKITTGKYMHPRGCFLNTTVSNSIYLGAG